jgi:hypothetical protein
VLLTLSARHNRDYHAAHPKAELLSRETHLSKRQIERILNSLADENRAGGAVLHISYGPLPIESKTGRHLYGNMYRFLGLRSPKTPDHGASSAGTREQMTWSHLKTAPAR